MARRNANTYHWQRYPIEKQQTQPLPTGNLAFRSYLSAHHLTIFDVAQASPLRLMTLWNIQHNIPIQVAREQLVRATLRRMTGVAYTGPIVVHPKEHSGNAPAVRQRR
jgi:hypothetical protein